MYILYIYHIYMLKYYIYMLIDVNFQNLKK